MISTRSLILSAFILLTAFGAQAQDGAPAKIPLTAAQLAEFQKIKTDTENKAVPLAIDLGGIAKQIYANMLADKEDQQLRRQLNKRLHLTAGRLLDIKGQSFRDMIALLTHAQKEIL